MRLGVADGAVGSDVDLLATRNFDVLTADIHQRKTEKENEKDTEAERKHTKPQ